jgi:hypothetical protein
MGSVLRSVSASLLLVGVLGWSSAGGANPAVAEALFREGRKLMEQGQLDTACAKLAESQRLDASPGTLGSLAQCHEKQGKTATAWAEYLAASRLATAQGKQAQAQAAKERAATLEGKLIYLTLKVSSPVPGLVLRRDDQTVEASAWDTRLPVDPGRTSLRAEAPGHEPFSVDLTLVEGKTDTTTVIPPLKKMSAAPATASASSAAPPASATPSSSGTAAPSTTNAPPPRAATGRPLSGYILGGAGLAALGVGSFLGLSSMADYRDAERACPARVNCTRSALDARDRAQSKAWGANVGVGLGLVGIALGTYLLFFSGEESKSGSLQLGGNVARSGAGVQLSGGF